MPEHPDRPKKPARPYPLTGDDNSDWQAWWNACDACTWSRPDGCSRGGTLHYANGRSRYLASRVVGGCKDWTPANA